MAAHRETLTVDREEINTFHTLGEIMNLMDELGSYSLMACDMPHIMGMGSFCMSSI